MKDLIKNNIKFILGAIAGLLVSGVGVYALTVTATQITYDNTQSGIQATNVKDAIDKLYEKAESGGECPDGYKCIKNICKRAKLETLHTEICNQSSNYCAKANYSVGDTITYGNQTVTDGVLTPGDAFDCDVNGDNIWDPETERFYYVSSYYDTKTKSFNDDFVALIYYSNTYNGVASTTNVAWYQSSNHTATNGPATAKPHLPTTTQWKGINLKSDTRDILDKSTVIKSDFSYSGSAARILTLEEATAGCNVSLYYNYGVTASGSFTPDCEFILENTTFSNNSYNTEGSWLESIYSASGYKYNTIARAYSNTVSTGFSHGDSSVSTSSPKSAYGVRPVIDVPKTSIAY